MNDTNNSEPATKADLKELATKADLQQLALTTKADLKQLALTTKADLTAVDIKLSIAISKNQADILDIKERMATRDDISRLLNHIDAFAAEALSYRNHDTLRGGKIMEHEAKLSNHESRLTTLETE